MSAELLAGAARTLRKHAEAAITDLAGRPWADARLNWFGGGDVGDFCFLMTPQVGLALAACMDKVARMGGFDPGDQRRVGHDDLVEVARAILRERP